MPRRKEPDSLRGAALDANNICPSCARDYNGHVQEDGIKFCTAEDCPSLPSTKKPEPADDFWAGADVLYSYTRAQAIEDGALVDMTQEPFGPMARELGIKFPIAMTATAFSLYVALNDVATKAGNDLKGRWWDVCWMFRCAVFKNNETGALVFDFLCVTDRPTPTPVRLKAVVGPDDQGGPCITFMLPDED